MSEAAETCEASADKASAAFGVALLAAMGVKVTPDLAIAINANGDRAIEVVFKRGHEKQIWQLEQWP